MKNSTSDRSLYIESDEEDYRSESKGGEDGNNSDSSNYSDDSPNSKPNSYNAAWPQSYRQSMDLYSSVQSPSIILGTPTLERFTSSFLFSSLKPRPTPEAAAKPFLPAGPGPGGAADDHQRRNSQFLPPLAPSRRHSQIRKSADRISSKGVHEFPNTGQSTYGQAVLNGMNVLCGVGILSTSYAVKEGGWVSLSLLFIFAMLSFYTGILLRRCLDSSPGLATYPDIGQAAFGKAGRISVSIILYLELYACCVEYLILESDNLSSLFPNAHLNLGFYVLNAHHLFALATTLAILPTCWLRDLSVLSYLSACGVIASISAVLCLYWVGLVDPVGYHGKTSTLNINTLPVAVGLYGFCYSGHAVLPNIYTSMEKPNQYPSVLLTSFGICTLLYAGVAVFGYLMFGESTHSQFTLNLPQNLTASKIAVWTTVVNPFTKYALTLSPVAMSLEELIPRQHLKSHMYPILIRTALVFSTLLVGLSVPFFGLVMALIGSLLTMLISLILPCACYLSILREKVTRIQASLCVMIITVGVISSAIGTFSALSKIVEHLNT